MDTPIRGLTKFPDWITLEDEVDLLGKFGPPPTHRGRDFDRARVERFGPGVPNSGYTEAHRYGGEIAPHLISIGERLVELGVPTPDAITVGWYLPGQYMRPHIDSPKAGTVIAVLALLGDATMLFTRDLESVVASVEIAFVRRMLIVMRDEVRWDWRHEILPVKETRVSIVFRRASPVP